MLSSWDRVKLMLVSAGVVLLVFVASAIRDADAGVAALAGIFAAAALGGAALIHRYR